MNPIGLALTIKEKTMCVAGYEWSVNLGYFGRIGKRSCRYFCVKEDLVTDFTDGLKTAFPDFDVFVFDDDYLPEGDYTMGMVNDETFG